MEKSARSNQPPTSQNGLPRRNFLKTIGAGALATFFAGSAWGTFELSADEMERWKRSLFQPSGPRLYFSDKHTDARMHLGGIGTGNLEIGADGQLTTWQLFNTLRDGHVPMYFAVNAGGVSKLLQTAGGPDWPRVRQIEMTGEYPTGTLSFHDDDLPVQVELAAFTPWEPLNTKLSSMPLAVFHFRISNPTAALQTVSLAAMMTNPIGYAAIGEIHGCSHPAFGSNVSESFRKDHAAGILMSAQRGADPSLDRPVAIFLLKDAFLVPPDPEINDKNYAYVNPREMAIPPLDRPESLKVHVIDDEKFSHTSLKEPAQSVIWLEEAPADLACSFLSEIKHAVESGATLVFSGNTLPLLSAQAAVTGGKSFDEARIQPDILFEDFESGYGKWTQDGNAFGSEPAHGPFANQQPISGFTGKGFANSYAHGDEPTGKLTSQPFTIERSFIRFLIAGGRFATTQARLVINGQTVRAASGQNDERFRPVAWHVEEFRGQTAHIEIVDGYRDGWGHIMVDEIVFTDWPGDRAVLPLLEELLPVRFSAVQNSAAGVEASKVQLQNPVTHPDARQSKAKNGLDQFTRSVGNGKVTLIVGQILDPTHTGSARLRQMAYATLCSAAGANYVVTQGQSAKEPGFGTLALAVLKGEASGLISFTGWDEARKQFQAHGRFSKLKSRATSPPTAPGQTANCALATTITVPAGATVEVPFVLAWHYPNKYSLAGEWMGCHYATQWPNARAVMDEAIANYDVLHGRTELFRQTFYDSTLPYWLLDAMTANSAIIRHIGVVFRIANGDIFGWEGSNGSCDPTCTHVWGYEQSLARLFPGLEREMRRIDYLHQQNADGGINNRTSVPSPMHPTGEHPFTDGHASCILKAYREALNSPDDSFFNEYWPHVKKAVEYLIARDAQGAGGQARGILQDDQWNTYDEALHGVTTFISGYYLAALRAGEEWARRMNDLETADHFRQIFENGRKQLVALCWNGEYFQQHLPDYLDRRGEVGPGCMSDQLIGQWWAHQLGLGYILPKDMVASALRAVFKYNWKSDLTGWKHSPRAFAGAGDKGLIICTWPNGGRPANVLLYSDEVWTGVEYQVAAHMIYEGLIEEGFAIAKGAREHYDGVPRSPIGRNPWCEIECGGHYTRAMSSWSLLLALSGYRYNSLDQSLRFVPAHQPDNFKCFFSGPEGWGSLAQKSSGKNQTVEIDVKSGSLKIKRLELAAITPSAAYQVAAELGGKPTPVTITSDGSNCILDLGASGVEIREGNVLKVSLA
jgi:uncharacterized protein (DUF608 family)